MKGRKRRGRSVCALSVGLAALLCALAAGPGPAYGAVGIEMDKTCRIDFTLDMATLEGAGETGGWGDAADGYRQYYGELAAYLGGGGTGTTPGEPGTPDPDATDPDVTGDGATSPGTGESAAPTARAIKVNLYKVAQVDAGGHYALLTGYGVDGLRGVEAATSATTAEEWSAWAAEAAGIAVGTVGEDGELVPPAGGAKPVTKSAEITLQGNTVAGHADDLEAGLYLVSVEPVDTVSYQYTFIPYLISLPNNYYSKSGSDEWIYGDEDGKRIYVGLKPEREDRYGDLIIEKTIKSYDTTFEGASFVFEIKALKEGGLVYSDVVSLNFDGPGTKQAKVENIPAGAEVTVTEVYSGASYSPEGGIDTKTAVVTAKSDVEGGSGQTAKVSFENKHDGTFNGGNASVVNHFAYTKDENGKEDLKWEKVEGDSQTAGTGNAKADTSVGTTGTSDGN